MLRSILESLENRTLLSGWLGGQIAPQTGYFAIQFDATPHLAKQHGVIGLSSRAVRVYRDLGPEIRFNSRGTIEACDGDSYRAQRIVSYQPEANYRFRLMVNASKQSYTVFVTPPGRREMRIARDFAFRSPQAGPLAHWAQYDKSGHTNLEHLAISRTGGAARIALPPAGSFYQGLFPGGVNTWEDDITPQEVDEYEQATGKRATWVYFTDNFFRDQDFPTELSSWIRDRGSVPFVRLTTNSIAVRPATSADPVYTLQRIIDGDFDEQFRNWAGGARSFATPLLVEWGTECNGEWFNWNGTFNGGAQTDGFGDPSRPDGPERFAAAFRHIVQTMRIAGADNITWVWHINAEDWPQRTWNRVENYHPGAEVVDWIGVSIYGPMRPQRTWTRRDFADQMDDIQARVTALAPEKPFIVAEVGATVGNPAQTAWDYADGALSSMLSRRWSNLIGFSWWNERWHNDADPAWDYSIDTDMRVQDWPQLAQVFRDAFEEFNARLQERPLLG